MVIKNLSTRQITLRDEDGNLYVIPSLDELVLSDDLIEDNTFKRWLRWRLRDIYISPFVNIEQNGIAVDSKPTLNFIEGTNTTITMTAQTNSIDIEINAASDVDYNNLSNVPTVFPVAITKAGSAVGTRPKINLIEGSNITLTVADNPGSDRVDVTVNATGTLSVAWDDISGKPTTFAPSGHQSSHQAGGSDMITGNLTANARVAVAESGSVAGTRRKINFIEGSGISVTLTDDNAGEKVDVTLATTGLAPNNASFVTLVAESGLSAESVLNVVIGKGVAGSQPATSDSGKGRLYYIQDVGSRRLTRDGGVSFGWEDLYYDWDYIQSKPTTFAPAAHKTSHQSGGSDAIKLDDLDTPDDNTDLDASSAHHGLMPKLPGDSSVFFRGDGTFTSPQTTQKPFYIGYSNDGGSNNTLISNAAYLIPCTVDLDVQIQTFWTNLNASSTGHIDLGIYTTGGSKLVSTGSVACPSTNFQSTSLGSPYSLAAGRYYLAFAVDNGTPSWRGTSQGAIRPFSRVVTLSFPLPSSITIGSTIPSIVPLLVAAVI